MTDPVLMMLAFASILVCYAACRLAILVKREAEQGLRAVRVRVARWRIQREWQRTR